MLFVTDGYVAYSIYGLMFLGSFIMLFVIRLSTPFFAKLLESPSYLFLPIIIFLAVIGVYSSTRSVGDVWVCLILGIVAYFMKAVRIPVAPLIVSFILTPILEINLRRGLMKAPNRSFWDFFSSPLFVVFMVMTLFVIVYAVFSEIRRAKAAKRAGVQVDEEEND
jgi:putative tricarboxylic transport membrane protein